MLTQCSIFYQTIHKDKYPVTKKYGIYHHYVSLVQGCHLTNFWSGSCCRCSQGIAPNWTGTGGSRLWCCSQVQGNRGLCHFRKHYRCSPSATASCKLCNGSTGCWKMFGWRASGHQWSGRTGSLSLQGEGGKIYHTIGIRKYSVPPIQEYLSPL